MKDLQIRRGWFGQMCTAPEFRSRDRAHRQLDFSDGYDRQLNVEIDRLVMIKSDLLAVAIGFL